MTMRAVIIRALNLGFSYRSENPSTAPAVKAGLLSAFAGNGGGDWPAFGKQLRQHGSAGPMHGGARGGFDGLQIQTASLALASDYYLHQGVDFDGDLLLDRFRRFFS